MFTPCYGGGQEHTREEDIGAFVVTGGDAPEVLKEAEYALDQVALFIGPGIVLVPVLAGRIGRDDGFAAVRLEPIAESSRVVGAVGDQPAPRREAPQQGADANQIVSICPV